MYGGGRPCNACERIQSLSMGKPTHRGLSRQLIAPFGYGVLPSGFTCGFIGGFAFAFPVLISLLYACTIAMNCQVVFVLGKQPKESLQRLYPWIAPIVALSICESPRKLRGRVIILPRGRPSHSRGWYIWVRRGVRILLVCVRRHLSGSPTSS